MLFINKWFKNNNNCSYFVEKIHNGIIIFMIDLLLNAI